MPYLTLNGVTVPVAVDSVSMSYEGIGGEEERSPSGELTGGPTTTKRAWRMTTTPVPVSEVDAWVGLIEGKGHTFPFDADLYSTRGRGTSSGTADIDLSEMKWGPGSARVTGLDTVTWAVGFGTAWTAMCWYNPDSTPWSHSFATSTGTFLVDGSPSTIPETLCVVIGGSLVIGDSDGIFTATFMYFDDAVALPYAAPASWSAALVAQHNAASWSALPRVLAGGTFTTTPVAVRGKVTGSKVIRCTLDGELTSGHMLEFTLREV